MRNRLWGQALYWNPIARPVYLSLVTRATLSRHTGKPIIQRYDETYGYWVTYREMNASETLKYLGKVYAKNI